MGKELSRKNFMLPIWKSGYCLPHCVYAAIEYFYGKDKLLSAKTWVDELKIDRSHWVWPATAILPLIQRGLNVELYDNDVDLVAFSKGGIEVVKSKYGKIGVDYFMSHFEIKNAIEDTEEVVKSSNTQY